MTRKIEEKQYFFFYLEVKAMMSVSTLDTKTPSDITIAGEVENDT